MRTQLAFALFVVIVFVLGVYLGAASGTFFGLVNFR